VRYRFFAGATLIFAIVATSLATALPAQEAALDPADVKLLQEITSKGVAFLATKGQGADGAFTPRAGAGITALAVTAMLRSGRPVDDSAVAKGLKALEGFIQADGGVYAGGRLKNYETCVAMLCFSEANADKRYDDALKKAKEFLLGIQFGEGQEREPSDPWYGGVGYGGPGRPDLSNTSYLIGALRAADAAPSDPAIQRALAFVSRCQNLEGNGNDTKFAALVKDGGFYYEIPLESVDPEKSPERETPNGGLRSYGSMTYAGLKSMIYAGLKADDPRVKATLDWVAAHYSVDENPGQGEAGLFYYYHTFGAAMKAAKMGEFTDDQGKKHDWRSDLIRELASRQQPDGSWTNEDGRWFENDANLATSFALLALSYCRDGK
jgi:hypothetical protein